MKSKGALTLTLVAALALGLAAGAAADNFSVSFGYGSGHGTGYRYCYPTYGSSHTVYYPAPVYYHYPTYYPSHSHWYTYRPPRYRHTRPWRIGREPFVRRSHHPWRGHRSGVRFRWDD